jgi:CRISPR-associated protein Cmr4
MLTQNLFIFTRTPLHVGAGASVGAIDQPIQRERHTGFPIIPASSLKGTFADAWNDTLESDDKGKKVRGKGVAAWLFGADDPHAACAGSVLFGEARLLAFPVRSAKGGYAWITCPLMLQRAARDSVGGLKLKEIKEPKEDEAAFAEKGVLDLGNGQIVLEEYTFKRAEGPVQAAGEALSSLLDGDPILQTLKHRLVILSNGMMQYFARNACEIAQHVRIDDETGTADGGGLFNQENVPSETLFYSVLRFTDARIRRTEKAADAARAFADRLAEHGHVFQFGGDASTGLGYCTVKLG